MIDKIITASNSNKRKSDSYFLVKRIELRNVFQYSFGFYLVLTYYVLRRGTSINDVRCFLRFFDPPPSPPNSILSDFSSCPYLMMSFFDPQAQTPPPPLLLMTLYTMFFYGGSKDLPIFFSIFGRKILSSKLSKEILWVKEILHNGLRSFLKKIICQQKGQESQNNGMSDFC